MGKYGGEVWWGSIVWKYGGEEWWGRIVGKCWGSMVGNNVGKYGRAVWWQKKIRRREEKLRIFCIQIGQEIQCLPYSWYFLFAKELIS